MKKPSIILADDHPLLMEGAKQFLEKLGHIVLDTCENGNDAYLSILKNKPDIAILDMDMPVMTGFEVAALVKQNQLPTKVVILTLYKQEAIANEVGKKIEAYVTKDSALEELEACLENVQNGKTYISSKFIGISTLNDENILTSLTPTELKVLRLLKDNLTSAEVAETLFISKRTVEKHRSNIISKLGLDGSHNALFIWIREHLDLLRN